jgi:hypothetical protein
LEVAQRGKTGGAVGEIEVVNDELDPADLDACLQRVRSAQGGPLIDQRLGYSNRQASIAARDRGKRRDTDAGFRPGGNGVQRLGVIRAQAKLVRRARAHQIQKVEQAARRSIQVACPIRKLRIRREYLSRILRESDVATKLVGEPVIDADQADMLILSGLSHAGPLHHIWIPGHSSLALGI